MYCCLRRKLATALLPGNAVEIPLRLLWFLHSGPCGRRHYIHLILNGVEEARYDVEHDL